MIQKQIHYLSKEDTTRLIESIKNPKHKTIVLLMLDTGMRVSEACSIKFSQINFKKKEIIINSLKKRGKEEIRIVPMSDRLYQQFGKYLEQYKKELTPNAPVFPSTQNKTSNIGRKAVWKILKTHKEKLNIEQLHPHALRHTFATHHLEKGTTLEEIKTMLGHKNYNTTLIYADIPTSQLKQKIEAVTAPPPSFWLKIYKKLVPQKKIKLINLAFDNNYFTIGRNQEISELSSFAERGINTLVLGNIGVGKSHLLKNIQTTKKILWLDDGEQIKKSLATILLTIFENKETVLALLWKDFTTDEIKKKIQRESTIALCDLITSNLEPKKYILIIDDITKFTAGGRKTIERLKDTFTLIVGAREVKISDSSFLWNFEKYQIKPLDRNHAIQLTNQLSSGLEIEDWQVYRQHIWEQSGGNPRAISELADRYRKEPFLTIETVRDIRHSGALPEMDMSWIVVLFLGIVMATRYLAGELDNGALRFIGAMAMILLLMYRPIMAQFKRSLL